MEILDTLAICMIVTSLAVFGLRNLKLSVIVYAIQTLLLVSIFFLLSKKFDAEQLSMWAIVAFFTKVILVPGILLWLIKKLKAKCSQRGRAGSGIFRKSYHSDGIFFGAFYEHPSDIFEIFSYQRGDHAHRSRNDFHDGNFWLHAKKFFHQANFSLLLV